MKRITIGLQVVAILIFASCGAEPEVARNASAFSVLPEGTLMSIAVVNPAAAIASMDGYAAGVPLLGETAVSGWVLSGLDCSGMDEVETRYGIDVSGTMVFYMKSMMPQSIGVALSVTDPDLFWSTVGLTPAQGDPIGDHEVSSFDVDFGKIYVCSEAGLIIAAGSRAELENMLERLDGGITADLPGIPDGSIYFSADVSTFGPIAAQQIAMFRPQIISEMQADGEENIEMATKVLDLYFDAINIFLTQTGDVSAVLTFGPEYLSGSSTAEFVEGSDLAAIFIPAEITDMTDLIPAGDVAVARVCLDPSTSESIMTAIMNAIGMDAVPQEMITFWSQASSSTAMSMFVDPENPFNIVAVYSMPEGSTLEDVQMAYREQFSLMSGLMGEMPGITFQDVTMAEYDGMDWVTFGMEMDFEAMQEMTPSEGTDVPMPGNFGWTAWLTEADGVLYLEMNDHPTLVPMLISGTWTGEYASSMPQMGSFSSQAEFAILLNLPAYMNMALSMSGMDVPNIDSDPVWIEAEVDFTDGGVEKHFRLNGTALVSFIGQAAQTFGSMRSSDDVDQE